MYFDDLALCRYHRGTLDADSWKVPLLAEGWLEWPHRYSQGVAQATLLYNLGKIRVRSEGRLFWYALPRPSRL